VSSVGSTAALTASPLWALSACTSRRDAGLPGGSAEGSSGGASSTKITASVKVRRTGHLGAGAHIKVQGKGRKRRATTLTPETVAVLHQCLKERHGQPEDSLFPTR